jgi:hypothetical protein
VSDARERRREVDGERSFGGARRAPTARSAQLSTKRLGNVEDDAHAACASESAEATATRSATSRRPSLAERGEIVQIAMPERACDPRFLEASIIGDTRTSERPDAGKRRAVTAFLRYSDVCPCVRYVLPRASPR